MKDLTFRILPKNIFGKIEKPKKSHWIDKRVLSLITFNVHWINQHIMKSSAKILSLVAKVEIQTNPIFEFFDDIIPPIFPEISENFNSL